MTIRKRNIDILMRALVNSNSVSIVYQNFTKHSRELYDVGGIDLSGPYWNLISLVIETESSNKVSSFIELADVLLVE